MTLKEIYDFLVEAGMPEIEDLYIDPAYHWNVIDRLVAPGKEPIEASISEQHAVDLITMHALRWWLKKHSEQKHGIKYGNEMDGFYVTSWLGFNEIYHWGDNHLEAIVEAVKESNAD